jgi:hypothetical protein
LSGEYGSYTIGGRVTTGKARLNRGLKRPLLCTDRVGAFDYDNAAEGAIALYLVAGAIAIHILLALTSGTNCRADTCTRGAS